jgi:Ca2+-binding RTX toxin-like protein
MELLLIASLLGGLLLADMAGAFDFLFSKNNDDSDSDNTPTPGRSPSTDGAVQTGTTSADSLRGGPIDDFLLGGAGADKLEGGGKDDTLIGEAGADSLYGGVGYDLMAGGAGNDLLIGGRGYDFLIGGAGDDTLQGGPGNDTLVGSSGADKLEGGAGADLISGYDFSSDSTALSINMVMNSPADATAMQQELLNDLRGAFGARITSDVASRFTAALSSADTNNADDQLFGGLGNDTILGDFSDTMTGGEGADLFVVNSDGANEIVTITDLNPAEDSLRIFVPAGTNPAVTLINGATPEIGVTVRIAGDDVARLLGLTAAQIPTNFIQVVNQ